MSAGGGKGGAVANINVTPLIDVLLVLLIIFMVIVPVTPKGLETLVPQPPKDPQKEVVNERTVVVQVLYNGGGQPIYKINEDETPKAQLEQKLSDIFAVRNEKVMFVKGDKELDFGKIAEVIDFGHQAGVDNIGLITPSMGAASSN
jgi:biopolymer transport protein ExbD/biopolymer transport protein TolR